jgi:hypothetical protein
VPEPRPPAVWGNPLFRVLASWKGGDAFDLVNAETRAAFGEHVATVAKELVQTPTALHGLRAETLFEWTVSALGQVRLLQQEDAGTRFIADPTLKVPDYQVVTGEGERFLVEVKNHYSAVPLSAIRFRRDYLIGLQRYGQLVGCPVKVAVYWALMGAWALVDVDSLLRTKAERPSLGFGQAMMLSEMASLGDLHVAFNNLPLRIHVLADKSKERSLTDGGEVNFIIGSVHLFADEVELTDKDERRIALFLMLWAGLPETTAILGDADDIEGVEFAYYSQEGVSEGTNLLGGLSQFLARLFRASTVSDDGVVTRLAVDSVAERHPVRLLASRFQGSNLGFVYLKQMPNGDVAL